MSVAGARRGRYRLDRHPGMTKSRVLKSHISDVVHRHLVADARRGRID